MKTRLEKSDGIIFLLALIGLGIFILLYPKLFPEASIRMDVGKELLRIWGLILAITTALWN